MANLNPNLPPQQNKTKRGYKIAACRRRERLQRKSPRKRARFENTWTLINFLAHSLLREKKKRSHKRHATQSASDLETSADCASARASRRFRKTAREATFFFSPSFFRKTTREKNYETIPLGRSWRMDDEIEPCIRQNKTEKREKDGESRKLM